MAAPAHDCEHLATYRNCLARLHGAWPEFLKTRADRLRHGAEMERVAEAILEDLFTTVLDWTRGDLTYQVKYADIILSQNLQKCLLVEVKRPGTLLPGRSAMQAALEQARRYADQQTVKCIAVSDGRMFYAADVENGGVKHRLYVDLSGDTPSACLWWVSVHGIYRPCTEAVNGPADFEPSTNASGDAGVCGNVPAELLHPKYQLPGRCFAYVGNANDTHTWKLPFLLADGSTDHRRLPKALQCILSNYRGARVRGIPESAMRDVLLRLARVAQQEGRLPPQAVDPAPIYQQLVLAQQELLETVLA